MQIPNWRTPKFFFFTVAAHVNNIQGSCFASGIRLSVINAKWNVKWNLYDTAAWILPTKSRTTGVIRIKCWL